MRRNTPTIFAILFLGTLVPCSAYGGPGNKNGISGAGPSREEFLDPVLKQGVCTLSVPSGSAAGYLCSMQPQEC